MVLLPYTATALSRYDIPDTPNSRNVVQGAIVRVFDLQGVQQTIYDDDTGAGGELQKVTNLDGQRTFYIEPGSYTVDVNGRQSSVSLADASKVRTAIQPVASVADLRQLEAIFDGQQVSLSGYYAGSTKGGGVFVWDAASTAADDDKTTYAVTGVATGRWKLSIPNRIMYNETNWQDDPFVVKIRHKYLSEKILKSTAPTAPKGFCIGNSIMQGAGSSSINTTIPRLLGGKLRDYRSLGTTNDWAPINRSVGGSTTALALVYAADNSDNVDNYPVSANLTANKDYCLILTLRNDATLLFPSVSYALIDSTLKALINKNIEPIFITDPPKIDMVTGEILDTPEVFGRIYDSALVACAANGATLIDAWKYFYNLKSMGIDIRQYSSDGVHPNDAGYEILSELIFQGMIAQSERLERAINLAIASDNADFISRYTADGGTVTTTTTISGLTTASTARRSQTGESTTEAFVLNTGDTIRFNAPAPIQGFIVHLLGGASGSVTAQYNFVNIQSGPWSAESGVVRESAFYYAIAPGVPPYDLRGFIQLTASGTVRVLGVTFLCERTSSQNVRWLDATEVGAWSDGTFSTGGTSRGSSTVGNYVDVNVYGSMLTIDYERGVGRGKFKYSIDNVTPVEIDCYVNAATEKKELEINFATEGWHNLRLEVTEKNAAASGNLVKFGNLRKYSGVAAPSVDYVPLMAGETIDTRVKYKSSEIVKVISGSPRVYDGLNGTQLTLNGTGSALVKLSR